MFGQILVSYFIDGILFKLSEGLQIVLVNLSS